MLGDACVGAEVAGCLLISMSRILRHHKAKQANSEGFSGRMRIELIVRQDRGWEMVTW